MKNKTSSEIKELRIDKWLWSARFFKTRNLASDAIKGGKIDINGARAKPSKNIKIDDQLKIRRGPFIYEVSVKALSKHRGPASQAAKLYEESDHSISSREKLAEQLKAESALRPATPGRPSKRDRRSIIRFTRKS
ncbi:MAG: RNA-binding S4 domain-containing protein [Gammaproteobacteria bacterium]